MAFGEGTLAVSSKILKVHTSLSAIPFLEIYPTAVLRQMQRFMYLELHYSIVYKSETDVSKSLLTDYMYVMEYCKLGFF